MQQPWQKTSLSGPLHLDLLAQLRGQLAQLQAGLPDLHQRSAEAQGQIETSQNKLAILNERLAAIDQQKAYADSALEQVALTLPSDPDLFTEEQVRLVNYWSYQLNTFVIPIKEHLNQIDWHKQNIASHQNALASHRRRIAIVEWRAEVVETMSDPAQMSSFPMPPVMHTRCDHDEPVCVCNIQAAFWLLDRMVNTEIAAEKRIWNPCRFSQCNETHQPGFKKMAKVMFAALARF